MSDIIIKPENSAPSQNIPAKSSIWLKDYFFDKKINTLLDFGCGRLRNEVVFEQFAKKIHILDIQNQIKRLPTEKAKKYKTFIFEKANCYENYYDVVVMISILHIIPEEEIRSKALKMAYNAVKPGGFLFIDVPTRERYYRQKCSDDNRYNDGYLLTHGNSKTFYKSYTAKELDEFVFNNIQAEKCATPYFDKHICRLIRKS